MKKYFVVNECDGSMSMNVGIATADDLSELLLKTSVLLVERFDDIVAMPLIDPDLTSAYNKGVMFIEVRVEGEDFTRTIEIIKSAVI